MYNVYNYAHSWDSSVALRHSSIPWHDPIYSKEEIGRMATKTRSSPNGSVWVDYPYTNHFAYYTTRFD